MNLDFWQNIDEKNIYKKVSTKENRQFVVQTMESLESDPIWTEPIIELIKSKKVETRCFISWLAKELQPVNYLEIGVRRGFSMAMVALRSPKTEIYGFDMWIKNYADVPNPGQSFVRSEMRKIGYEKEINLIDGDSHKTLPAFFGKKQAKLRDCLKMKWNIKNRPENFELILIDGDHSLLGAFQDLTDTIPHCAVGGVVVFDDIHPDALQKDDNQRDPHGWENLLGVWHTVQKYFQTSYILTF